MNFLTVSGLLISISSILCSLVVLSSRPVSLLKSTWGLFSFMVGLWGFGLYKAYTAQEYYNALFWLRFLNLSAITIPVFFVHFVILFIGEFKQKINEIKLYYLVSFVIIIFSLFNPNLFIPNLSPKLGFKFYPNPGMIYYFFFLIFIFLSLYGVSLLIKYVRNGSPILAIQAKYILLGTAIGFLGGGTTFFPVFNIPVYPCGAGLVVVYVFLVTYAIIKYRFMDIRIIITRAAIFVLIYTLILGIPILVGFQLLGKGLWLFPISMMGYFAIAGPFIYFYIQKRAEDRLLKEQKSYQSTLRQASAGMGRIKDLRKLLNMIVFILTRTVRLEHSVIYMYDDIAKDYALGAFKRRSGNFVFAKKVSLDSSLIAYLNKNHNPIIYEEIKQKAQDYKDAQLALVANDLQALQAALVVPIYIGNRLVALVDMGRKESGKLFTEDDLAVFSILSNQAALAFENAKFYEDMKITQQQLFQAEKMATIGIMADGLSHQINNRFHALGFIAGDALDTIKLSKNLEMSDKIKEVMQDLEKALNRVQDNVVQGGEVVQGLLKYTRKGEEGFVATDVDAVISNAYEMAQFKIKSSQMSLVRNYDINLLPKVKGNATQLQEVFFNLIDNAYDAMMQRKNELKEPEYHPQLTVYAKAQGESLEMIFEDNGMGVKEEDIGKLFTPFFTTKLSSKKGTGLGLYVIRKIIEDNHKGKVEFSSSYLVGTQMKLILPLIAGG